MIAEKIHREVGGLRTLLAPIGATLPPLVVPLLNSLEAEAERVAALEAAALLDPCLASPESVVSGSLPAQAGDNRPTESGAVAPLSDQGAFAERASANMDAPAGAARKEALNG